MQTKKPSLLDMEQFVEKRIREKGKSAPAIDTPQGSAPVEPKADASPPVPDTEAMIQAIKGALSDLQVQAGAGAGVKEVMEITTGQRSEINLLRQDVELLKHRMDRHQQIITDQREEIQHLRREITRLKLQTQPAEEKPKPSQPRATRQLDENYKRMLLTNIIQLIDEKDFSEVDVSRLFKKEGFPVFPPYESWNQETVNQMYLQAKANGLG